MQEILNETEIPHTKNVERQIKVSDLDDVTFIQDSVAINMYSVSHKTYTCFVLLCFVLLWLSSPFLMDSRG